MRKYKKYRKGVRPGYKHTWAYKGVWKERKNKDGSWKIDFRATKGKKARGYGQFKKGFKIKWGIRGVQYATKIAPGKYQTRLIAKKYRIRSGYKI